MCAADIHPAARIGRGILMASGCDIGRVSFPVTNGVHTVEINPYTQFVMVYNVSPITSG